MATITSHQDTSSPKPATDKKQSLIEIKPDQKLDLVFYQSYYPDLKGMSADRLQLHWQEAGSIENRFPNFTELLISKNLDPKVAESLDLDLDFYCNYYLELEKVGVNNIYRAKLHYLINGIKEKRSPNLAALLKSKNIVPDATIETNVDFDFYLNFYPDLNNAVIKNKTQAQAHYLIFGRQEDRLPNLHVWMENNHFDTKFVPKDFEFKSIYEINKQNDIEIKLKTFLELLSGRSTYPIRISHQARTNANFYHEVAKHYLTNHHREPAKNLLKVCLSFEKRGEFLELLGNIYLDENDHETAAAHYEEAIDMSGISKWLFTNLANCKRMLSKHRQSIEILVQGIELNPEFSFAYDRLEEFVHEYWLKQQGSMEAFGVVNDRHALITKSADVSSFIYNSYIRTYGTVKVPATIDSCNLDRILIVGDYHISQCVRYRINQKIEQLEAAGKKVTAISWTDLGKEQNILALHDVVIFYRVSAQPQVIKAIAQVNATGKLSIYEIDDLLFDGIYPPPIETYGGYVDLNTYVGLTKGMALFNSAARLCRIGIASTQLLANKLQPLVLGKKCFVHRNGLDKLNSFKPVAIRNKTNMDIFYGSGTMAHNSDFSDLVLPAMTKILNEFDHTRLLVAGYLNLPSEFLKQFGNRIRQIPLITNVQAYWSLLEQADINVAVLHDDIINGCKSELKWFEAATLGIPTVMSSTANYRDVINHGEDGLIATTPDEWYEHLKALVKNPELRFTIAQKAQEKVLNDYSVQALADNINTTLNQALKHSQAANPVKRKKVALVNVYFPPQSHGGATRVIADNFDLLQRDYGDQFELCVFTTDYECKPPYQMSIYSYQGVRVYRATILWRENMDWHAKDDKITEIFNEFLAVEQPDLVHFHCVQRLTASAVEATRKAKIPYLITLHDAWWISDYQFLVDQEGKIYPEGHPDPYETHALPNNVSMIESIERTLYLKGLLRDADAALSVSESFAEIYRKNEIPMVEVNKNGISESVQWQPKNTQYTDKVVCAHIGGMAEHKGYFLLEAAINKLQPKNIELLVVDHSKQEGYSLQTYWGKVPVTFIGPFKQKNIVDLYNKIDVLCAPSKWPESYGLVTREANACGCWVVTSNKGGIGEDVIEGESGFIIEPDLASLVDCLALIDKTPDKFKGIANAKAPRLASEQVKELSKIYASKGLPK
jgi:glycosyltransferase involved in cell wall biosynthesis